MITIIATTTHPKENNSGISKVEFFTLDIVSTTDICPKYIYLLFLGIVTFTINWINRRVFSDCYPAQPSREKETHKPSTNILQYCVVTR